MKVWKLVKSLVLPGLASWLKFNGKSTRPISKPLKRILYFGSDSSFLIESEKRSLVSTGRVGLRKFDHDDKERVCDKDAVPV